MRKLMLLVTLFVIAALGWGGYWFFGATALERTLGGWLDTRRAHGWVAEAATLDTRGFPNRFDTTLTALELADPETRVAWSAPVFQLLTLSYKPNHVIAIWPGEQRVAIPGQEIEITSQAMRGSFMVAPDSALPLSEVTMEAEAARFASSKGWETGLSAGLVAMRQSAEAQLPNSYDLYLDASDITPSAEILAQLGGVADLPAVIARARIEATVAFDKRWDRTAIEDARPQPRQVRLDALSAQWGDLDLRATGTLTIDADGMTSGEIAVQATNWREMVAILEASGKIDPDYVGTLTKGLELLAALKGDPETLDVPLGFKRGLMSIGPVPIGPAPKIALP